MEAIGPSMGASNAAFDKAAVIWDRLIESINPAGVLVTIAQRMGGVLRHRMTAEDIFQDALHHAFRDWEKFEYRGPSSFKRWLLAIVENRIRHAAEAATTQKRRGELRLVDVADLTNSSFGGGTFAGPMTTTRPSKVAELREQAAWIEEVLASMPDELGAVVRLRVLEARTAAEVAQELGIGISAVHHRARRGIELFQAKLKSRG